MVATGAGEVKTFGFLSGNVKWMNHQEENQYDNDGCFHRAQAEN